MVLVGAGNLSARLRKEEPRMPRILVIDDEPDVRWLFRMTLERRGYEVLLAEDGLRGIAMAQRQHPDAIVLDLMMPVMDGYGVLDALVKDVRTSNVPVVVVTAKALPEEEVRCSKAGARSLLVKPLDPADLVTELDAVLGS
jgi:CheY-like chemotaxis protein